MKILKALRIINYELIFSIMDKYRKILERILKYTNSTDIYRIRYILYIARNLFGRYVQCPYHHNYDLIVHVLYRTGKTVQYRRKVYSLYLKAYITQFH